MTDLTDSSRNWGALPLQSENFEWTMEADGPMVQGPLDMSTLRGQRISLILDVGQFGLLAREGSLKALYLDGAHHLHIGQQNDQIHPNSMLFFLSTEITRDFRWIPKPTDQFKTSGDSSVIGRFSVRIEKPARFYHRFLRTLEDWSPETISNQLEALVHEAFNKMLSELCGSSYKQPGGLQSTLMRLGSQHLDEYLCEHGLYCVSLAAYTAAPPIEHHSNQTAGQSADLLHN